MKLCVSRTLMPSVVVADVVERRKFCDEPGKLGSGIYASSARAAGSMRSAGMTPLANAWPVSGSMGDESPEKSPFRIAAVGTVAY